MVNDLVYGCITNSFSTLGNNTPFNIIPLHTSVKVQGDLYPNKAGTDTSYIPWVFLQVVIADNDGITSPLLSNIDTIGLESKLIGLPSSYTYKYNLWFLLLLFQINH